MIGDMNTHRHLMNGAPMREEYSIVSDRKLPSVAVVPMSADTAETADLFLPGIEFVLKLIK
jgi:hypothetical protein